eukprot:PLAT15300.4.p1 GENE.PLAT15300.4~~PLAT15300.4.p1  ORF type:complete len:468 (+),score=268.40 PLAT15300.4:96-1406(+)
MGQADDLEWLFRLPFNFEVWCRNGERPPLSLRVDTFVDASGYRPEFDDPQAHLLRIKGVVMDHTGKPQPFRVPEDSDLRACLFLGAAAIDKQGGTHHSDKTVLYPFESPGTPSRGGEGGRSDEFWSWLDSEEWETQMLSTGREMPSSDMRYFTVGGERFKWSVTIDPEEHELLLHSVVVDVELQPTRPLQVRLPRHLYGELAKTPAGLELLRDKGHVRGFIQQLRSDSEPLIVQRAALWAIGHIGACELGLSLLLEEDEDIVDLLVDLTETSPSLSLRGTCVYVLGLLSRSSLGRRQLARLGWGSPSSLSSTVAVPLEPRNFFHVPRGAAAAAEPAPLEGTTPLPDMEPDWEPVLTALVKLSNYITQAEAYSTLRKLHSKRPTLFASVDLMLHAHSLLERYNYRLPMRRFIHMLFSDVKFTASTLDMLDELNAAAF